MEIRIYKIDGSDLVKVKNVLEMPDMFDIRATCERCGKKLEGKFTPDDASKYDSKEVKGKLTPAEKGCECGGHFKFEKKTLIANEFARNGYTIRSGDVLGHPGANYLQIKAEKTFFDKNEKMISKEGAKTVAGKEAESIQKKLEEEENSAAAGMGAIFG